jgi:hypothetical protein
MLILQRGITSQAAGMFWCQKSRIIQEYLPKSNCKALLYLPKMSNLPKEENSLWLRQNKPTLKLLKKNTSHPLPLSMYHLNPSGAKAACLPNCGSIPKPGFHTQNGHFKINIIRICDNCHDTEVSMSSLCQCGDGTNCKVNTIHHHVDAC